MQPQPGGAPLDDAELETTARTYVANAHHATRTAEALGLHVNTCWKRLQKPEVKRRVRELSDTLLRPADVNAQRVMLELGRIAFADHRSLYDEDGELRNPRDMDDDAAAALSGVTYETRTEPGPRVVDLATGKLRPSRRTVQVVKIRKHDKVAALGLLARHFKLVGEDNDGVNALANVLADRLKAARQRVVHAPPLDGGPPPSHGAPGGPAELENLEIDADRRDVTGHEGEILELGPDRVTDVTGNADDGSDLA